MQSVQPVCCLGSYVLFPLVLTQPILPAVMIIQKHSSLITQLNEIQVAQYKLCMYRIKRDEDGEWGRLQNEELYSL